MSLKSSWVWLDMSPQIAVANVNVLVAKPAPVAGTVKEVWLSANTIVAAGGGIVTIYNGLNNLLSSASIDLEADLVALTAESEVLTTAKMNLVCKTTDTFKALWTLTTVASTNAYGCLIAIEPDTF